MITYYLQVYSEAAIKSICFPILLRIFSTIDLMFSRLGCRYDFILSIHEVGFYILGEVTTKRERERESHVTDIHQSIYYMTLSFIYGCYTTCKKPRVTSRPPSMMLRNVYACIMCFFLCRKDKSFPILPSIRPLMLPLNPKIYIYIWR